MASRESQHLLPGPPPSPPGDTGQGMVVEDDDAEDHGCPQQLDHSGCPGRQQSQEGHSTKAQSIYQKAEFSKETKSKGKQDVKVIPKTDI